MNLLLLLTANLNLADLDLIFIFNSFFDGLNTLFLYSSNKFVSKILFSGRYLDGLDLFLEKFVKKYFTILSSNEWKLTTKIFPPGFSFFVALIIPLISSVISLLTKILSAWKVFVHGFILFEKIFFYFFQLFLQVQLYEWFFFISIYNNIFCYSWSFFFIT